MFIRLGKQVICLFVAMSVLNTSIDIPDSMLYSHVKASKMASFNEMESILELVIEKWLGRGNVFKERKGDDSNDDSNISKKIVDWTPYVFYERSLAPVAPATDVRFFVKTKYFTAKYLKQIPTPPPDII